MTNNFESFLICIIAGLLIIPAAFAIDWNELNGEHFIVYYTQDEKFAKDVLENAEVYYRRIAPDLGYPRYSEFWTWDKRAKIYIYPNQASFLKATGQPEWSYGMAEYKTKSIASFAGSPGLIESILPHEMAHLIFRDFVGFKGEIQLWLDEGVAQWEEIPKRQEIKRIAKQLYKDEKLLSLNDIMTLDIANTKGDRVYIRRIRTKDGKEAVLFLSSTNLVDTFYLEAASLVGFLIERYGSDNFAYFCRQLRDGKSLEEALTFAYPTNIRSITDLENKWWQYLEKES